MKNWIYILAAVMFLAALPETGWSIENTAIRNPAGLSTVPPSSFGNGLYRSPNPIDRSGNLAITGNIRRGRHFQGPVPYRSTTTFGATLGSTSLDSFLRDSAGAEDFGYYSNKYRAQPYYSPTETVATVKPGRSGVFKPVTTKVSGRVPDTFGLEALSKKQVSPRQDTGTPFATYGEWEPTSAPRSRLWSTPLTIEEVERSARSETGIYPESRKLSADQYQKQMEQLRRDLMKIRGEASKLKTEESPEDLLKLIPEPGTSESSRKYDVERPPGEALQPFERRQRPAPRAPSGGIQTQVPKEQKGTAWDSGEITSSPPGALRADKFDKELLEALRATQGQEQLIRTPDTKKGLSDTIALEQIRQQLANLETGVQGTSDAKNRVWESTQLSTPEYLQTETDTYEAAKGADQEGLYGQFANSPYLQLLSKTGQIATGETDSDVETTNANYKTTGSVVDEINALSSAALSARAKQIMGPYKSVESFNQARFQRHMVTAQAYLKQGKYYQAANSFALASIYDSKNPSAYGGKSIALFAAGEYISSALFLSRALDISERYAQSNINLTAILGSKDKIDKRIADAEEWLERSNAPELEFLLGYVYYQMGRLGPAEQAIDAAQKAMPASPAVKALKKAIAEAIKYNR